MSAEQQIDDFTPGRPILFRNATVLSMDAAIGVLDGGDVLVRGERIERVGHRLDAPESAVVVDAAGGILMPGMVDTHRHMWQTALRGLGADWTLSQFFVFYYLNWGKIFRPEDIYAGNLLAGIEALDAGVTTTVDWSHGLQTPEHGDAAVEALRTVPGRFVLAYGNLLGAPWEWANSPEFRSFVDRHFASRNDMLGLQLAFDVTGDEQFPEKAAFEAARELDLPVTTHAGVWGATDDNGIRLMWEHGFMDPKVTYVHAASLSRDSYQRIAASGGTASVSTESEQSAGQGYPPTWQLRRHGIPVSLSMDTSVWWSADLFSAMRATLSADRSREHLEAQSAGETVVHNKLRARDVVEWATIGGARALGLDDSIGSVTPGKKADLVLVKNDRSPVMFPMLHPYGHVAFQAGRGDVHTVLVNGSVVKFRHELAATDLDRARTAVAATAEYARTEMGEDAWQQSLEPEIAETELIPNPYTYSDYRGDGVAIQQAEA
ncbi:cytosine/adenosine deaminase-related metal-dependent hydrolase [Halopolyspora algeriensis]|uniref:Cytosine/adenosine deaminase-related metal-dependent hydrolase n=1 Tax=Halopolyspora algeriensis TaxID=1500506 RepID=A0A368VGA5_9ACTN|nr:amidohydrolase family protein [Halopolyspora algeriensis]RCW39683.1 cytosine/adenosine deaminase-related metal-dependent hydrolase [Halopolyspora algeriensis]TQM54024.1 cytosine/adenosine deaminase-related metal-dependent hydrolase [Halopolyspora algeriensis]